MAHSMANFLGTTRQVPSCILNASQPAHRAAAPQTQHALRSCQLSRGRVQQRQQALQAWILHAVRSDQQGSQVDSSTLQLISDLTNKVDKEHATILADNSQAMEGIVEDAAADSLKGKVEQSIQKLAKGLLERETEVRHFLEALHLHGHCITLLNNQKSALLMQKPSMRWGLGRKVMLQSYSLHTYIVANAFAQTMHSFLHPPMQHLCCSLPVLGLLPI